MLKGTVLSTPDHVVASLVYNFSSTNSGIMKKSDVKLLEKEIK